MRSFYEAKSLISTKCKQFYKNYLSAKLELENTKNGICCFRTPKVPRQQAVYSLVASLLTQRTKLEKRFMQKYPNARLLKNPFKFNPKFKGKNGWVNDSFCVEKCSFQILPGNKSFSFFKNLIIKRVSNEIVRSGLSRRTKKRKKQYVFREIKNHERSFT